MTNFPDFSAQNYQIAVPTRAETQPTKSSGDFMDRVERYSQESQQEQIDQVTNVWLQTQHNPRKRSREI